MQLKLKKKKKKKNNRLNNLLALKSVLYIIYNEKKNS